MSGPRRSREAPLFGLAADLPRYTANPADFDALDDLTDVRTVALPGAPASAP